MSKTSLKKTFKPLASVDCSWIELYCATDIELIAEEKQVYVEFPGRITSFKKSMVMAIDSLDDQSSLLVTIAGDEFELSIPAQQLRQLIDNPHDKNNCLDLKKFQSLKLCDTLKVFQGQRIDLYTLADLLKDKPILLEDISFLYPLRDKTRKIRNTNFSVEKDHSEWGNIKMCWGDGSFMRTAADESEIKALGSIQQKLGLACVDYTVRGHYVLKIWTKNKIVPPAPKKMPLRCKKNLSQAGFNV